MHIHLDLMGGLAGDMFLAASIDAGLVDLDALTAGLRSLGLGSEITIHHEKAWRGAMSATHARFENWDPSADSDHRHLSTILEMIAQSKLSASVKDRASELFRVLGASEAKVHGIPIETVHFHEVGAVDSILDFVSAAFVIDSLGDVTWSVGDVPTGYGTIETAHGEIPLPAPATADLLRGFNLVQKNVPAELVTPTGAAILRSVNPGGAHVQGSLRAIGYGAGTREIEGLSNVVRLLVFDESTTADAVEYGRDVVCRLSADVDDMNPELLSYVATVKLPQAGALDVTRHPSTMKKGRVGTRIEVLCPTPLRDTIVDLLMRETTTFGVRVEQVERRILERSVREVETKYGKIRVKDGFRGDTLIKTVPEFESCRAAADRHGVAVTEVYDETIEKSRS